MLPPLPSLPPLPHTHNDMRVYLSRLTVLNLDLPGGRGGVGVGLTSGQRGKGIRRYLCIPLTHQQLKPVHSFSDCCGVCACAYKHVRARDCGNRYLPQPLLEHEAIKVHS